MNHSAPPPVTGSAADSSARVETETVKANLRAPNAASSLPPGTRAKRATGTRATAGNGTRSPQEKAKPPSIKGGYWKPNSGGWDFVISVSNPDGTRSRPSLGHLSKAALEEMKREHKGQALADALAQWVKEREREKGG